VTDSRPADYEYMEEVNEGVLRNIPFNRATKEERSVLDVGCGYGALAEAIERKGYTVCGIESHEGASSVAEARITKVIRLDLTDIPAVRAAIGEQKYDYLVFSDVLEHLCDPAGILKEYLPFLKEDGKVIVSVPNVAVWNVRLKLLFGVFEYSSTGTLDRTHLRFFTFRSAQRMLTELGLQVIKRDLTAYLVRAILPLVKSRILRSRRDKTDARRQIIDSGAYKFYLNWVYPLEHVLGRAFKSWLAFRIILVGERNG
jgi:2-polyprenyl-3-methyl-5-hydroxy-6-metoxy-1,4-benzoquinol methylase